MPSQIDDTLIDSIVAGVLDRLRGSSAPQTSGAQQLAKLSPPPAAPAPKPASSDPLHLSDRVITQALLQEKLKGAKSVRFAPKAILTPTARDYLRTNWIEWAYATKQSAEKKSSAAGPLAVLIVRSTPAVERVITDLLPSARTELLGCPDDAAKLAAAEIARGGIAKALIFAEQTHRAACLANRTEVVKAVAVRDALDAAQIKKQLRANVWCVDPTARGYFELRNVVKAIQKD